MKTVNDFFCGAGGMGLGFKQAGFKIKGAWDFDKDAVETYKHNVGDHVQELDITKMSWSEVPKADVWTFGFPCQDLSKNGAMAGLHDGKRSKMFFEVMRLLDELIENDPDGLPDIIMAENVETLRKYLPVLEEEYLKRGYKFYFQLFNSKYWSVAQNRKRFFVVGVRMDIEKDFEYPAQEETIKVKLKDILDENPDPSLFVKVGEKYENLIFDGPSNCLIVKQATIKGFDLAYPGDSINIAFPTSKTRRGRVGKQVAQTILTGREQVAVLNDLSIRYYSLRETARMQGFPDNFKFSVKDSVAQKQIGNAVTVNVAKAIAEKIKEFLS